MFVYYVYLVLFSMKDVQCKSAASISTDIQHDDRLQEKAVYHLGENL